MCFIGLATIIQLAWLISSFYKGYLIDRCVDQKLSLGEIISLAKVTFSGKVLRKAETEVTVSGQQSST